MALTPRQQRFVAEYAIDLNATQAAIRAGYSPTSAKVTASRMLTNANVRSAVDATQQKVAEALGDSAEDVLRDALDTYRAASQAGQFSAAVSALVLRSKRHPAFSEKHEVDARVGVMLVRQTRDLNAGG